MTWIHRAVCSAALLLPAITSAAALDTGAESRSLTRRANERAPPEDLQADGVSWTGYYTDDVQRSGADEDGVWYIRNFVDVILEYRKPEGRTPVMWTGNEVDRDDAERFSVLLDDQGGSYMFYGMFPDDDLTEWMPIEVDTLKHWRAVYRGCKAMAIAANPPDGKVWVQLDPSNGATIFSPPSQNPGECDQPVVGETWHYAELPYLMRNLNVEQIWSFWRNSEEDEFTTRLEWRYDHAFPAYQRTYYPEIEMDTTPMRIPERDPMKRYAVAICSKFARLESAWRLRPTKYAIYIAVYAEVKVILFHGTSTAEMISSLCATLLVSPQARHEFHVLQTTLVQGKLILFVVDSAAPYPASENEIAPCAEQHSIRLSVTDANYLADSRVITTVLRRSS